MRKVFLVFVCLIFIKSCAFCAYNYSAVKFIYLNGANSNTQKKKEDFTKGIYDVQKHLKQVFETDCFISKNMLKNGKYKISETPEIFFWGFYSKTDLQEVQKLLDRTKKSLFATSLRNFLVHNIHDIVWICRNSNMKFVTDELNKQIISIAKKGEKAVLLGHSAGGFVTYAYLLNKARDFNTDIFTGKNENKYTCPDALIASNMAFQLSDGTLLRNSDENKFFQGYMAIDEISEKECMPDNTILGVMNFGSSLSLFYPNRLNYPLNPQYIYQTNLLEYIKQNNLFFLSLNFLDDPLSLESVKINSGEFVFNYMEEKSPSVFITSHYTYWKHPKKFALMAKEGYIKGFSESNIRKD